MKASEKIEARAALNLAAIRYILPVTAVLMAAGFAIVVEVARRFLDGSVQEKILDEKNAILRLPTWKVALLNCPNPLASPQCVPISVFSSDFPTHSNEPDKATDTAKYAVAVIRYELTFKELSWIEKHESFSLVIPRNVHRETRIKGSPRATANGMGNSTEIALDREELLQKKEIEIEFNFSSLSTFGPLDLPMALVDASEVATYASLPARQLTASHLVMQLGMGFPLFIGAIALVLDHSLAFGLLSLFGASRAIRSFIPFAVENFSEGATWWHSPLYFGANGLCLASFAFLIWNLCHMPPLSRRRIGDVLAFSVTGFILLGYAIPGSWINIDAIADAGMSLASIPLIVISIRRRFNGSQTETSRFEFQGSLSNIATLFLLILIAVIQAYVNIEEIISSNNTHLKSILDWKHIAIFPGLAAAALFEVGFTSRKVKAAANEIAEKQMLDRELSLARDFQRKSFPAMKADLPEWRWRAFYRPAVHVGGDWFDVRELEFVNGDKLLVAAIADVTGHGLAPALSTTILSTIWSLWCEETALEMPPATANEKERFLQNAPARLHAALSASRKESSATAAFALIDFERRELTYLTAGHPPILVVAQNGLRSLMDANPSLGGSSSEEMPQWTSGTTELSPGEAICLYSDGILANSTSIQSWISGMRRSLKKGEKKFQTLLVERIRASRRAIQEDKSLDDDMTILIIQTKIPKPITDSDQDYI